MKSHIPSRDARGFALVATLSLVALITLLVMALLSLSRATLRANAAHKLAAEARQNARLALLLAIGDLQSATGPDQRVTASASVLASQSAQPHLTGVWQGSKWDGTGNADFDGQKKANLSAGLPPPWIRRVSGTSITTPRPLPGKRSPWCEVRVTWLRMK